MASLDDVITVSKMININLGQLVVALQSAFPVFSVTSTTATGGSATLPGNPVGFVEFTDSTGTLRKIPFYDP